MKFLGNIFWFIFIGIFSFIYWLAAGLLFCITLIGIPFGLQCFKIGVACAAPIGMNIYTDFDSHPIANIIWLLLFGWEIAVFYLSAGVIFCITVVGIPIGLQCFKLMRLALLPFGARLC